MSCNSSSGSPSSLHVNFDNLSTKLKFGRKKLGKVKKEVKLPRVKPRYFTAGGGVNNDNQRDVLHEPSPFVYPKDLEEFAQKVKTKEWRKESRKDELRHKYYNKQNNKSRQKTDLLRRLYVKEPVVKSLQTIQDIDPDFFKIVEGRPIPEKLRLREYIETVRNVLRTKILIGYRGDDVLLIDEKHILEQKEIDRIKANFQSYQNAFEAFLYEDHTKSMNVLKQSDLEASLAQEKYEEFRALSREYSALKSILYSTEEKWRNCKLFQRFLYIVSPMSWRKKYDYYYNEEEELAGLGQPISAIFAKYRLDVSDDNNTIDDLIDHFHEECAIQSAPEMYFEDPNQLLEVFKFMELQNLNSLLHSEELAVPLENVREAMARAEQMFTAEINSLQEIIDKLAGGILWEEERAKYLEELALELINGEFKNLIVAEEVLNLGVFVEDVYESRIGPNDANLSMSEMMRLIETKFRNELISLDQMPSEQVAQLEASCYKDEAKIMKEAQKAARQLAEFEMLYQKMQKVFSPPYQKQGRELKWRSSPVNPPKVVEPPPRSLTQEEKEYLELFTEYCKFTDDPKSYGIDITQEPTKEDNPEK